jgi:hypothetical protein
MRGFAANRVGYLVTRLNEVQKWRVMGVVTGDVGREVAENVTLQATTR